MAAAGQNPTAQNPTVQTGVRTRGVRSTGTGTFGIGVGDVIADEPIEDVPQIPALLGGPGSSLAFRSEMERSNYLSGGVNVGAAYDDNALLGSGEQVGNATFSIFPNLALEQSTSRTRWTLRYGGGLTVNQRLSSRNQGSHDLNFDSEFRLSPHVNLRVAEDFALTTGMFTAKHRFQSPAGTDWGEWDSDYPAGEHEVIPNRGGDELPLCP